MKKAAFSILAIVMLLTLVCGSALAATGDITVKKANAYADPDLKLYMGTIPKYTSVLVRAYGDYAEISYNGVKCYVKPSVLTRGAKDYDYIGTATLKKGAKVYQGTSSSSRCVTNKKNRKVYVYKVSDGKALVRTSKTGIFGHVSTDSLTDMKAY